MVPAGPSQLTWRALPSRVCGSSDMQNAASAHLGSQGQREGERVAARIAMKPSGARPGSSRRFDSMVPTACPRSAVGFCVEREVSVSIHVHGGRSLSLFVGRLAKCINTSTLNVAAGRALDPDGGWEGGRREGDEAHRASQAELRAEGARRVGAGVSTHQRVLAERDFNGRPRACIAARSFHVKRTALRQPSRRHVQTPAGRLRARGSRSLRILGGPRCCGSLA